MGRLYRRGKIWWADLREEGKGRVSLRTTDRQVAQARLRRRLLAEADPAEDPGPELRVALAHYLALVDATKSKGTFNAYNHKASHLARLLGGIRVKELRREDVTGYYRARLSEGAARLTVNKESTVLRCAVREAGGDPSVVPPFRAQYKPRERFLSRSEFTALLEALPEKRRLWLVVACYTGARLSELRGLRWEHIDWSAGTVRIVGSKTERSWRRVPMSPALRAWLEPVADEAGPVLERWGNIGRDLKAACARAGIDPVTPNDLRRTFASWLKQAGVDSMTVAHLLGHGSTRMVELVYGRLSADTYAAAVAELPDCAASVPPDRQKKAPQAGLSDGPGAGSARKRRETAKKGSR